MLVVIVNCFNINSISYIEICVHIIIYLYKECCCKYKSLNFIVYTDGKLLKISCKGNLKGKIRESIQKDK